MRDRLGRRASVGEIADHGLRAGRVELAGRWWAGYRRWMLHQARVAALGRADVLVIGTELGGVTRHRNAWRRLIRDVRRIYRGPLT